MLLRHGESIWNKENRFTGWTDVDLTEEGITEAKNAAIILKNAGFNFDIGFTSYLKRAIKTMDIVLEDLDLLWIPIEKSWRLNERFYGALQGLNKAETALKYGDELVQKWRRDPHEHPPALTKADPRYPGNDIKYKALTELELPLTENLSETMQRVMPYWKNNIAVALNNHQHVIVTAHGNSLRALIQYIDDLTDQETTLLNIPTGKPLVYELNDALKGIKHYYLE